ncbi:MAG: hypothetical protein J5J00_11395 [Deltaproteobacteria bacterium]|nr:hypothetical protein [Deltaproteobacteria bacterium]
MAVSNSHQPTVISGPTTNGRSVQSPDRSQQELNTGGRVNRLSQFDPPPDLLEFMINDRQGRIALSYALGEMVYDSGSPLDDSEFRIQCLKGLAPWVHEPEVAQAILFRAIYGDNAIKEHFAIGHIIDDHKDRFHLTESFSDRVVSVIESLAKYPDIGIAATLELIEPLLESPKLQLAPFASLSPLLARIWKENDQSAAYPLLSLPIMTREPALRAHLLKMATQEVKLWDIDQRKMERCVYWSIIGGSAALSVTSGLFPNAIGIGTGAIAAGYVTSRIFNRALAEYAQAREEISKRAAYALLDCENPLSDGELKQIEKALRRPHISKGVKALLTELAGMPET